MIYFTSDFVTISLPPNKPYIHSMWPGSFTFEDVKLAFSKAVAAAQHSGRHLYLSDVSRASAPCNESLEYIITQGYSMMAAAGIRRLAVVYPRDTFTQLRAEQILLHEYPLEYRMFPTFEEAEAWLMED